MKKRIFTFVIVFFISFLLGKSIQAQSLYFCEEVSKDGEPVHESNVFTINSDGGSLYFLVKLPKTVNCTFVTYKLNTVDSYGNEEYNTTITQDNMKENWSWFYKEVTFYKTGVYMVYVKDCNSNILTAEKITIKR